MNSTVAEVGLPDITLTFTDDCETPQLGNWVCGRSAV